MLFRSNRKRQAGEERSERGGRDTHAFLCVLADHESRDVDEEDERDPSLLAELNELRSLEGSGGE